MVFDSYEKEDRTRKTEYGRYGRVQFTDSAKNQNQNQNQEKEAFEHIIRYDDGIKSDFVLASCSVPVNYNYTRLNVETHNLAAEDGQEEKIAAMDDSQHSSNGDTNSSLRFFWDGGLLANTPLRETYLAHKQYWQRVRKLEDNIPKLKFGVIYLHPAKQEYVPYDYDGVIDRKNDIIYHDRTQFQKKI